MSSCRDSSAGQGRASTHDPRVLESGPVDEARLAEREGVELVEVGKRAVHALDGTTLRANLRALRSRQCVEVGKDGVGRREQRDRTCAIEIGGKIRRARLRVRAQRTVQRLAFFGVRGTLDHDRAGGERHEPDREHEHEDSCHPSEATPTHHS